MNARATRRPRGGAGYRPGGRSGGRSSKGPSNGCVVVLFLAGSVLGALGYAAVQVVSWL